LILQLNLVAGCSSGPTPGYLVLLSHAAATLAPAAASSAGRAGRIAFLLLRQGVAAEKRHLKKN
jgi:hypothetical protein